MYKPALLSGTLFALLAVILGAFGAHYLKTKFTPEILAGYETGIRYQFYHAFALLILGIISGKYGLKYRKTIAILFVLGTVLFSGSIYVLAVFKSIHVVGLSGIGILTPMGGTMLVLGWSLLGYSFFNLKPYQRHSASSVHRNSR